MKKSNKKKQRKKQSAAAVAAPEPTRRNVMQLAGYLGAGATFVGGAGLWGVGSFRAHAAEHDLSRIGQGQPAIVQIHDPSCALCTELQRETRRALRCDFAEEPIYLVASIRTDEGAAFAGSHGVPHVTLLVMDGAGSVDAVLSGVRQRTELKSIFEGHFGVA